jgi:hypothetical protein
VDDGRKGTKEKVRYLWRNVSGKVLGFKQLKQNSGELKEKRNLLGS